MVAGAAGGVMALAEWRDAGGGDAECDGGRRECETGGSLGLGEWEVRCGVVGRVSPLGLLLG